jgi:hypothetical protein|tara:strand:+ start:808 stop:1149 length:342 start_codon:yes stop_codon:yes gene_type:complete
MKKSSKKNLTTTNKSIILKLCLQDDLLVNINKLSLEDLIAIKLELSANSINNRLYGFDLWRQSNKIIKEALLKFAISTTNSKKDAARFLGLTYLEFKRVITKYNVNQFFTEDI